MKGKGKGKGKPAPQKGTSNIDNIMNAFGDDAMDDGFDKFEKNFNPEKEFDMPVYNNIDSQFDTFSKMLGGGGDDIDLNKLNDNNKESEDDKLLKAILGEAGVTTKKKKNNDMEELSKALKMAEVNLNKKHGNDDAELLKGILGGAGNTKKKKDDGMDELNSILNMADKKLKDKDKDDMALIGKFLSKEEINAVDGGEKKEVKKEVKKEENKIEDKYPLQQEKIFHRINQMKSLTVLEKEIDICKMVIAYKKKNNLDFKEWENKIEQANKQLNDIKTKVENNEMDLEAYKKTVKDELSYEQKLLDVYLAKDQTSTPMQKDNIKKRINIRILVIKNELKDSAKEGEDKNDETKTEEKKEQTTKKEEEKEKKEENNNIDEKDPDVQKARYIDLLAQQYLSARNYFKENELKEQEKDCNLKCKSIITAKIEIQKGNIDYVDLDSLPKPIKPEYIYGYSDEERTTKFKEIIAELIKQKEEIVEKKKEYNDKLSQMKKREFEKMKDQAKYFLDSYQSKIDKFDEEIEKIKEKMKDKWTPVPEYCNTSQEEKVEKINKDIPEYTMRVHIGKTDYDKDNVYLKVKLNLGEKEMNKEVKMKKEKDFDETWDWTFDKREYKSLHRKHLEIQLERSYWYKLGGTDVKGSMKVELKNLKDSIKIEGNYKMELESKRLTPSIEIKIDLRFPFVDKQYETITKEVFSIKKIYPPFNPKSADIPGGPTVVPKVKNVKNEIKNEIKDEKEEEEEKPEEKEEEEEKPEEEEKEEKDEDKKEEIKEEKKEEIKEEKKEEVKEEKKEEKPVENKPASNKVDRSMFTEEELNDIDGVDYLNSLRVLEAKLKAVEDEISKISGRTPKPLLQRKAKISFKIKLMKQEMDNGNVSPKDYFSLLSEQMVHNRQLFALFKQEKDLKNAKIIAERIKLMMAEMTELKDVIKNNK